MDGKAQFTSDGIQNFHTHQLWEMLFFHLINNGGFSKTSGPVFVVIIYLDPMYFQTGLQGGITKLSFENNMPNFLVNVLLIIHRKLHFVHDGASTHFSVVAYRYLNQKLHDW
jgi:hypothetical protein